MIDDVFLKDIVIAEGLLAGLEDVDAPQAHHFQEGKTEPAKIRTVAETPWGDGRQFPAGRKHARRQPDEGGVKVRYLHPCGIQPFACGRFAVDLLVRRIEDGMGEALARPGKQPFFRPGDGGGDKIFHPYLPVKGDPGLPAGRFTMRHRLGQFR